MKRKTKVVTALCVSTAHAPAIFARSAGDTLLSVRRIPARARRSRSKLHVRGHQKLSCPRASKKNAVRDHLILAHLPLVKAIATRIHQALPVHVELEDIVQAGILGLLDAAIKYNSEKQVAFSAYAKHRIKGAILDSLRQLDWASRDMRRRHKEVEAAERDLATALGRAPIEAEVAEKLGMDVRRFRTIRIDLRNVGLFSASTRVHNDDDLPAPDFPDKPEGRPDRVCERAELRTTLSEALKKLPERYQKIVRLYYNHEMTMKDIGGVLGVNESRVSQIHKSALVKMAKALENVGIRSGHVF